MLTHYALAWHFNWERQALAGKYLTSWTTYQNDICFRFEDKEAWDQAYLKMEKVVYKVDSRDMFTKIQMHNEKAQLMGAALKKLILDRLPINIFEKMHTVDLTRMRDQEMMQIISKAGRTAEKWAEEKRNLGTKVPETHEKAERWENPRNDKLKVKHNYSEKETTQ
jgi:hypothetical protein